MYITATLSYSLTGHHVGDPPAEFFSRQPAGLTRYMAAFWLSQKSM